MAVVLVVSAVSVAAAASGAVGFVPGEGFKFF